MCHQCISKNSEQWFRCYCVIVIEWWLLWKWCGLEVWTSACQTRPSQLAAAPASHQSRHSLNRDYVWPWSLAPLSIHSPPPKLAIYPSYAIKTPVLQRFLLGKPEDYCLQPPATSSSSPYLHTCILLGASPFSRMFLTLVHPLHQSSQFQLQQFHQQQSHADKSKETEIIWNHKWLISSKPYQPSYPLSQLNPSGPLVYHQSSHQSCGSSEKSTMQQKWNAF